VIQVPSNEGYDPYPTCWYSSSGQLPVNCGRLETKPEGAALNQIVTLTGVEVKSKGSNKRGPWALRIFDSAGGTKFQTFDVADGEALEAKIGTPVELTYEVEENGNFTNNVIKSFKDAAVPDYYSAGQTTPQAAVNTNDRELRIMRQSALDRAINTVGHGIVQADDVSDLFKLADTYILYFEAGISAFTQPNEVPEEVVTY
jgi:hypothetical protein